jgi:hypothetical protein
MIGAVVRRETPTPTIWLRAIPRSELRRPLSALTLFWFNCDRRVHSGSALASVFGPKVSVCPQWNRNLSELAAAGSSDEPGGRSILSQVWRRGVPGS